MTTERIQELVEEQLTKLTAEEVNGETKLEDIGMDSLDTIEFIMEMERELDISIPDDKIEIWAPMTVSQMSKEILNHYEEVRQ